MRGNLVLVGATFELLDAAVGDLERLATLLRAQTAEGWAGFPEALPILRNSYVERPRAAGFHAVFHSGSAPRDGFRIDVRMPAVTSSAFAYTIHVRNKR